jgi:hypothetical protein
MGSDFPVVEPWKGHALRIAVELLIFVKVGHKQIRWRPLSGPRPVPFWQKMLASDSV